MADLHFLLAFILIFTLSGVSLSSSSSLVVSMHVSHYRLELFLSPSFTPFEGSANYVINLAISLIKPTGLQM
ncbi:hypothetical protein ASPTUDRAFT_50407 [Aspergillus tubingensis CBS 134.48]|uniref:Uncharacterized protein n=1 Tax=Aspergillus tubingensis (strain CBS 134.48) TaxID=767770 RepID=A0A1L9NGP6_ASPTC|nr:hypothetical protein ASPTUDRAFT_50407 [Aspergillus tubingensis CBS 134.48]